MLEKAVSVLLLLLLPFVVWHKGADCCCCSLATKWKQLVCPGSSCCFKTWLPFTAPAHYSVEVMKWCLPGVTCTSVMALL